MKFILETDKPKQSTFGDVVIDQFFVRSDGDLCQKIERDRYNVIADHAGTPCSFCTALSTPSTPIKRILPKVIKIEF